MSWRPYRRGKKIERVCLMVPSERDNRGNIGPDKSRWRRYVCVPTERGKMAAIEEDDRPKRKLVHEIGQDLALLSVEEINDRILLLNDEVARLQAALAKKHASRSVADQFFKR